MTTLELLSEIEAFLARDDVKMTESTFGRLAVNDGKLVTRLRIGKDVTFGTAEKVRSFMEGYDPHESGRPPSNPPETANAA